MRDVKRLVVDDLSVPVACKPEVIWLEVSSYQKKIKKLHAVLSQDEKERARRFAVRSARDQFIVSRGMLRVMIGKRVGLDPRKLVFAYGPQGKPRLDSVLSGLRLMAPLHFNVSHSKGVIILGIGILEVGADVERRRKIANAERVALKILSPQEMRAFKKLDFQLQQDVLIRIWTYKEAIVKALGCGFSMSVRSFQVWRSNPKKPLEFLERIRISDRKVGAYDIESAPLSLPKNFVGTISILYPVSASVK